MQYVSLNLFYNHLQQKGKYNIVSIDDIVTRGRYSIVSIENIESYQILWLTASYVIALKSCGKYYDFNFITKSIIFETECSGLL